LPDLNEKKQKFLEILLTLGSLLAIFLGFVVERTGVLLNWLVLFGVLFSVSSLFRYAASLFPEKVRDLKGRIGVVAANIGISASFSGLVSLGAAYYLGLSISGNTLTNEQSVVVGAIFVLSFFGVYWLILEVLGMKEQPPPPNPPPAHVTPPEAAQRQGGLRLHDVDVLVIFATVVTAVMTQTIYTTIYNYLVSPTPSSTSLSYYSLTASVITVGIILVLLFFVILPSRRRRDRAA
jgi:hypothetical protein